MTLHGTCVILITTFCVPCTGSGKIYYYDDGQILHSDDQTTTGLEVEGGITMGRHRYSTVYASTNGLITFDARNPSWNPQMMNITYSYPHIAPFWTDIYPNVRGSNFYHATYRSGRMLEEVSNDVRNHSGRTSFKATWMLLATWSNAPFFCCINKEKITVQSVIITDGVTTYAMFNYINVRSSPKKHKIVIGYTGANENYQHPLSFSHRIYKMSSEMGNRGIPGFLFYNIGRDVDECSENLRICNNGSCYNTYGSYICTCHKGFTGSNCEQDINECIVSHPPCFNFGTCVNTPGSFHCDCTTYWEGAHCEIDKDECVGLPCQSCGQCINTPGSYVCRCREGYSGPLCSTDIDECLTYTCPKRGKCQNREGGYKCDCLSGWKGENCDADLCTNTSCLNNGVCNTTAANVYECECSNNTTGRYCEQFTDDCSSQPCQNNGTCEIYQGGHTCVCSAGFTGSDCATDIDECAGSPCIQGATCINIQGSYICNCPNGLQGKTCTNDEDECASSPCHNSGYCQNTFLSYSCHCMDGYTGDRCLTDVDECLSDPCYNSSTCVNTYGSFHCCCDKGRAGKLCNEDYDECIINPCINNGTCLNTDGDYNCTCSRFFTSKNCEEDVNECLSNPCLNNATCENYYGGFECHCIPGLQGMYCDEDIDECQSDPCQNGGACINFPGSFRCDCIDIYSGVLCETDLCNTKPADVVFLIDSSLSTSTKHHQLQLDYISNIVKRLTLSAEKFQVAVISYSTEAYVDIPFNSSVTTSELLSQIQNITYKNGTTNILAACEAVQDVLPVILERAQYVFLLTDGMPSDMKEAKKGVSVMRQYLTNSSSFNEVFLVAFGEDVRHQGLREMSIDPYFFRDVYDSINLDPYYKMLKRLVHRDCNACSSSRLRQADIVLLIDTSSRISNSEYNIQLNAAMKITQYLQTLQIDPERIQVGVVAYSTHASEVLWLNETYDIDQIYGRITSIPQDPSNSSSNLAQALEFIRNTFMTKKHGTRENVRKFIINFNAGVDENITATLVEVEKLANAENIVATIGIGTKFDHDVIIKTSSSAFYAYIADENSLEDDIKIMMKSTLYIVCSQGVRL